ncbi:MAG TPA: alpha/beta hydrolase [Actinomycetota bacterium]|nr:alpha/beta hydrolase [Actinomycetota bacterium]
MHVEVNGTRLWFDVDGPTLVPSESGMRERPVVVMVHGGPATWDHSYFKPWFGRLAEVAQVVYLDLRAHGRSARGSEAEWTFERCADDVRAFCDVMGIARPIVFGHSMGGFVVMLYGARHPGHAAGLVLQSTFARYDLERIEDGFRRFGGDEVGELARRSYGGGEVSDDEWGLVFRTFGPNVPDPEALARRVANPDLSERGSELFHRFDVVDQLVRIDVPTLVSVGELDPVTPVEAAREIAAALPPGLARLEVLPGAGHFPWLDIADVYWPILGEFVRQTQE